MSEAEQGYLGIQGVDVSDESAKMYNMPTGVYISDVVKNGGAQQAGLTKGSVITGLREPQQRYEFTERTASVLSVWEIKSR